ncbi:MAG: hypothetical protein WC969_00525 [Elusimicrobiota bacterium]|jgi:hypothetical protein
MRTAAGVFSLLLGLASAVSAAGPITAKPTGRCCVRKAAFFTAKTPALYRRGDWGASLGVRFSARAEFSADDGCSCGCCEFRQFIRGRFTVNGREVRHELSPGRFLDGEWREDGGVERAGARGRPYEEVFFGAKDGAVLSAGRYGHRGDEGYDPSMDRYTAAAPPYDLDRLNGCFYMMNDIPVLQGRMGDRLEYKTDFEQRIVDVCNGEAVKSSALWSADLSWTANEADIYSQE